METQAVADIFDRDRDGFIEYKQFVATLKPEVFETRYLLEKISEL